MLILEGHMPSLLDVLTKKHFLKEMHFSDLVELREIRPPGPTIALQ